MKIFAEISLKEYGSETINASKLGFPFEELFNGRDYEDTIIALLENKHKEEDTYDYCFDIKRIMRKSLTGEDEDVLIEYKFYYTYVAMINFSDFNFQEADVLDPWIIESRISYYFDKNFVNFLSLNRILDINNNDLCTNKDVLKRMIKNEFARKIGKK